MTVNDPILIQLTLAWRLFLKNLYTKFHENPTNILVTDTRSPIGGPTKVVSPSTFHFVFFLIRKECINMADL